MKYENIVYDDYEEFVDSVKGGNFDNNEIVSSSTVDGWGGLKIIFKDKSGYITEVYINNPHIKDDDKWIAKSNRKKIKNILVKNN